MVCLKYLSLMYGNTCHLCRNTCSSCMEILVPYVLNYFSLMYITICVPYVWKYLSLMNGNDFSLIHIIMCSNITSSSVLTKCGNWREIVAIWQIAFFEIQFLVRMFVFRFKFPYVCSKTYPWKLVSISTGNGLAHPGYKPLLEPIMTLSVDAYIRHSAS